MAFGPSYSYSLVRLLYGKKWSDGEASTVLRYYCLYVIVLAMNGNSPYLLLLSFFIPKDIYCLSVMTITSLFYPSYNLCFSLAHWFLGLYFVYVIGISKLNVAMTLDS